MNRIAFRSLLILLLSAVSPLLAQTIVTTGGSSTCIPAPGDFDGDGDWDLAQLCSGILQFFNPNGSLLKSISTGTPATAIPAPADYNGDGRTEVVVFSSGAWHFWDFTTGAYLPGQSVWTGGVATPVPMDYDADGRAELSLYANGAWHFFNDNGSYNKGIWVGNIAGNIPVPFDRNNDGREDAVLFNGSVWHFFDYLTVTYQGGVITPRPGGGAYTSPKPTPLDLDGDGDYELGVYEIVDGIGLWHLFEGNGTFLATVNTGPANGDRPISRRLLP